MVVYGELVSSWYQLRCCGSIKIFLAAVIIEYLLDVSDLHVLLGLALTKRFCKVYQEGLSWQSSGQDFTFQCREYEFDSCLGS